MQLAVIVAAGHEVEYVHQACKTMHMSLQLLAFVLRAALLAKIEEGEAIVCRHFHHHTIIIVTWELL